MTVLKTNANNYRYGSVNRSAEQPADGLGFIEFAAMELKMERINRRSFLDRCRSVIQPQGPSGRLDLSSRELDGSRAYFSPVF